MLCGVGNSKVKNRKNSCGREHSSANHALWQSKISRRPTNGQLCRQLINVKIWNSSSAIQLGQRNQISARLS